MPRSLPIVPVTSDFTSPEDFAPSARQASKPARFASDVTSSRFTSEASSPVAIGRSISTIGGRSMHRHETVISTSPTRSWVNICFRNDVDSSQSRVITMKNLEAECEQVEDICVKRLSCCYSTFARKSSDTGWDRAMEDNFARSRYVHFRAAFMRVSFLMMLGALVLAVYALGYGHHRRTIVLTAGVAPFYLFYGTFAWKRKQMYLTMSGTFAERFFIGLLCAQMLTIVAAEWARPDFDYGMLVMHIGFVHNFTPLGAGAMQMITAAFGLLPYVVLKVVRHHVTNDFAANGDLAVAVGYDSSVHTGCNGTGGTEALLVSIIVPIVIFIYQAVVTMRRDESLRLDWLSRMNLRMQQELLAVEKTRNEGLLGSMLPRKIIAALKANEPVEPQHFEDVTVVFIEICQFDNLCAKLPPADVVEVLNIIYLEFDHLSDLLHVYKVETVGQVYMAVVGCPEPMVNHADVAAHFALAAKRSMRHIKGRIAAVTGREIAQGGQAHHVHGREKTGSRDLPGATQETITSESTIGSALVLEASQASRRGLHVGRAEPNSSIEDSSKEQLRVVIHIGLHSGPLRAGIVGIDSPRYKLFGDTVNTASRMESTCEPGRIQVSHSTLQQLTKGMFRLEDRGQIQVKGKGAMHTAYLCGYAEPGDEDSRRVVIEHGCFAKATAHAANELGGESPSAEVAKLRAQQRSPCDTASIFEEEVLRLTTMNSLSMEGLAYLTGENSTSALVSAALGHRQSTATSQDGTGDPASCRADCAAFGGEGADQPKLGCLDRLQLLFLLVPTAHKHPARMAELRRDLPKYLKDTHAQRIIIARNLTITWLLILAVLSGMDFFMDVLDEDLATYRMAIVVRLVGNTLTGLVYLLLVSAPAMGKVVQPLTNAMLTLQGVALLACGTTLYNSEPAIVALYGAYILFYTVCTVFQRLMLCLSAVTGYVCIEYVRCGMEGVLRAAGNIGFLLVFIAAMACSVRLQEYLQHVSHYDQHYAESRLEEIRLAKAAGSQLLTTLLPPHVVNLVGEGLSPIAEHHSDVTIMFTDIKGFTAYSSKISAHKLVTVLNSMYSAFDEIISNWALHKVEIIGDAYFVSAGCPPPPVSEGSEDTDPSEYAMRGVEVGLALLRTLPSVCDDTTVQMRVGLHTGSVVAGVVGKKGPRYHLFGSTVAYAEKMESHGIPGKVQLSSATHALLQQGSHAYDFEEREIVVEGEENLQRTWVVNRSNSKVAFQIQKKLMTQRRFNQQGVPPQNVSSRLSTHVSKASASTTDRPSSVARCSSSIHTQESNDTSKRLAKSSEAIAIS